MLYTKDLDILNVFLIKFIIYLVNLNIKKINSINKINNTDKIVLETKSISSNNKYLDFIHAIELFEKNAFIKSPYNIIIKMHFYKKIPYNFVLEK